MGRLTVKGLSEAKRFLATASEVPPKLAEEITSKLTNENNETINSSQNFAQTIFSRTEASLKSEDPHFRVGGTPIYFPTARVILLRPNAKHTPYQAKFLVPLSFNKLDLRDYLFHVYGLRALNVTTQLLPSKIVFNASRRYRTPQLKKMTIDMEDPFIWPGEESIPQRVQDTIKMGNEAFKDSLTQMGLVGSDNYKPLKLFDGLYKYNKHFVKHEVEAFVPKKIAAQLKNIKKRDEAKTNNFLRNEIFDRVIQQKQQ